MKWGIPDNGWRSLSHRIINNAPDKKISALIKAGMEDHRNTPEETHVAEQESSREKLVQALARETRDLLEQGETERALAFFRQMHPVDQAEVLVGLTQSAKQLLLTELGPDENAEILEHVEPEEALKVLEGIENPVVSKILDETSPDVAADILNDLPQERSQEILEGMQEYQGVIPLLEYPDDTAGGLMVPDYPVVREHISAANALDRLRLMGTRAEDFGSIFVIDDDNKLVGTISITRLALARPSTVIADLVQREFVSVRTNTDQEELARLMERYNVNELPVLDQEGHLVGVILAEDMVDVVEDEATEDMYRMAGVAGERVFGPLHASMRRRLPWLYLNLVTAFLAASVISLFEATIARVVALAVFLPVVAGMAGNGGTQTLTVVVRSMALGDLPLRLGFRLLARELSLGFINGALLGIAVGVVASLWKGIPMLGVALGLAMLGNMMVAALAGAGVPLILRLLRLDPAVSSAVFVTTFTDIFGFLLYLGFATLFIEFLV
jgi:magnesium transporter